MSDDLSAFFAKKKDKKKKAVVKIEEVGQVLERRAKWQEEYEQENADTTEKRIEEEKVANSDESEWIEYNDSNQGRLDGLKLKDMGLETEETHVDNEKPEDLESHEAKTWGQVNSEKKTTEEPERAVTITDKQMAATYKAPAFRSGASRHQKAAPVNFDVSNDSLFPSLADASKIEKSKKEDAKSPGGWTKAGMSETRKPYNITSGSGRESALAAVKNMVASSAPAPIRTIEQPPAPVAAPATTGEVKTKYVPPRMRANN